MKLKISGNILKDTTKCRKNIVCLKEIVFVKLNIVLMLIALLLNPIKT
jgi:hypothetical protein